MKLKMVSQEKVVNASAISVTSPSSSSSSSPSVSASSPSSSSSELAPSSQELRRGRGQSWSWRWRWLRRWHRLELLERQRADLISPGIAAVRAQRHFRTPEQIAALRAEVGRLETAAAGFQD